jgi:hypothetical protein
MKTIFWNSIVVCFCLLACHPIGAEDAPKPKASLNLEKAPLDLVLNLYTGYTKAELIVASHVPQNVQITLRATEGPQTLPRQIEIALWKQAGIVLTHLDDNHVSVTYNDKIKTQPSP